LAINLLVSTPLAHLELNLLSGVWFKWWQWLLYSWVFVWQRQRR
jgi:hypothetical protein